MGIENEETEQRKSIHQAIPDFPQLFPCKQCQIHLAQ